MRRTERSSTEFQQPLTRGRHLGPCEAGTGGTATQLLHQHIGGGGQEHPQLIGEEARAAGALTGARREEMAALRWQDVDFRWSSLWVKDKVAEEGRKLPLTPYLSELLASLPRRNRWVFSSPAAKDGRLVEPRIPHNRALGVAGWPHVTLHGLRRTFASLAEWVEMPTGVVAQIMGRAPNATAEKHYINRPLELLAVWHGKYEAWILKQAKVRFVRTGRKRHQKSQTNGARHLKLVSVA